MIEIEQKFAHADFSLLQQRLSTMGAIGPDVHSEVDQYFNAPDRDFATTGEAFRLRSIGDRNHFTYKGPRRPGLVKVRTELEPGLADGPEAAAAHGQLLVALGYRPVACVRKTRSSYTLTREGVNFTICLDDVEGLGRFAEVETVSEPAIAEAMASCVLQLGRELGLSDLEPRSYLTMLLQTRPVEPRIPKVVTTVTELRQVLAEARRAGHSIGFVPTMGALHVGHRSLIEASRPRDGFVVVSIFVNPTQFGPNEDLARYPRPFEADVAMCREAGVDVIFHPTPEEMYPRGFRTYVEVTGLQDTLEGAIRPGHFRGVATVVLKLFHLVQPDRAYFGQKDAQQVRILQQMVHDLAVPVNLIVCPTSREPDGLARSSRNVYLDSRQRASAVVLSRALQTAESLFRAGERSTEVIRQAMLAELAAAEGAVVDYALIVDADSLTVMEHLTGPALAVLAVRFGTTRLIDNSILR